MFRWLPSSSSRRACSDVEFRGTALTLAVLQALWLRADVLAGCVVGIIALPLAMAFAISSGLTPQAGIYCYLVGGVLYALFGTSRRLIVNPDGARAQAEDAQREDRRERNGHEEVADKDARDGEPADFEEGIERDNAHHAAAFDQPANDAIGKLTVGFKAGQERKEEFAQSVEVYGRDEKLVALGRATPPPTRSSPRAASTSAP
mgnify:CR=1 FL=1